MKTNNGIVRRSVILLAPLLFCTCASAGDIDVLENAGEVDIRIQFPNNDICLLDAGCSVDLTATSGTAVAGRDFIFDPITLRWNRGQKSATNQATAEIIDNQLADGNRIFLVTTSNAIGIEPSTNSIEIEIIDDEANTISQPQQEIKRVVTNVCPGLSAESSRAELLLKQDCDALVGAINSDDPNAQGAIASVTPDQSQAPITASVSGTGVQQKNIGKRLSSLRSGNHSVFRNFTLNFQENSLSVEQLLLSAASDNNNSVVENYSGQKFGVFVIGEVRGGSKEDSENEDGFELSSNGVSVGMDYRTSKSTVFGAAVGLSKSTSEFTQKSGELESNGVSITLFGSYFTDTLFYVDFGMGVGGTEFDQTRRVFYSLTDGTSVDQEMFSNFESKQNSLFLSAGKSYSRKSVTYTPSFKVEYIQTEVDAYEEEKASSPDSSGAGWLVRLDEQRYESLLIGVGFKIEGAFSKGWGVWSPHLGVDLISDSTTGAEEVVGRFVGDPEGNSFSLVTDTADTSYARVNLGSSFTFANGRSSFIDISTVAGLDNYSIAGVNVGFRWSF